MEDSTYQQAENITKVHDRGATAAQLNEESARNSVLPGDIEGALRLVDITREGDVGETDVVSSDFQEDDLQSNGM